MFKWYCIKHHTWGGRNARPQCVQFRLRKGQPKHLNNCIYHKRRQPHQMTLFGDGKSLGYEFVNGAVTELIANVPLGELDGKMIDTWFQAHAENRIGIFNLSHLLYQLDSKTDIREIFKLAGKNPSVDDIIKAMEQLIRYKTINRSNK